MKNKLINDIIRKMLPYLDNDQLAKLEEVLKYSLYSVDVHQSKEGNNSMVNQLTNYEMLEMFISAKRVEGCSEKTLRYYEVTIAKMFNVKNKNVVHVQTDDLRQYLSEYQQNSKCSKANIDNIRRILSSFFSWLEDENYILKSPVRRIHKIRTDKGVKEKYTDEALELMRDNCNSIRD